MKKEKYFNELVDIAIKAGATAAKIIPSQMVEVDERVRLKCEVPRCAGFGRYLTCPPNVMDVETFSRILARYEYSLLVQIETKGIDSTDKGSGRIDKKILRNISELHLGYRVKLLEVVEAVESGAFKREMPFATGFIGGSCPLCERCVDDKMSGACRHPFRARPAMEGVGIDVFKTAKNAGMPIHLSSSKNVLWTGLVLLK